MKKIIFSVLLTAILLLNTGVAFANTEGVKIIYEYTADSASTYSISIPTSCEVIKEDEGGFGFSAESMNLVEGYEVVIRINQISYAQDDIFYLYLDGKYSSPNKIPCTLKRRQSMENIEEVIDPGERAIVATFRGTNKVAHKWGTLSIIPGNASVIGKYSNTLYFDISVEPIK